MARIVLYGGDHNRNIQLLNINVTVRFSPEYYRSGKADQKLTELEKDLEAVMGKYFEDYSSDRFLED